LILLVLEGDRSEALGAFKAARAPSAAARSGDLRRR
jgi:hypothetical protein